MADASMAPRQGGLTRRRLLQAAGLAGVGAVASKAWFATRPLPPSAVRIEVAGDARFVRSNGVQDHERGRHASGPGLAGVPPALRACRAS